MAFIVKKCKQVLKVAYVYIERKTSEKKLLENVSKL